jgi:hypothetical protein
MSSNDPETLHLYPRMLSRIQSCPASCAVPDICAHLLLLVPNGRRKGFIRTAATDKLTNTRVSNNKQIRRRIDAMNKNEFIFIPFQLCFGASLDSIHDFCSTFLSASDSSTDTCEQSLPSSVWFCGQRLWRLSQQADWIN